MAKDSENFPTLEVNIKQLHFDPENPRYAPYHNIDVSDEVSITRNLAQTADLKELIQSISENGYINIEPLISINSQKKNEYIVLEGNRRLAVLKIFKEPKFAKKCGITGVPELSSKFKKTLDEVTITVVPSREAARPLIGFKHINGPQKWDSYAKAVFAKNWYEASKANGITLKDIAKSLGDGHQTIKRLVFGLYVLEQAEKKKIFNLDNRYPQKGFSFSHLYTALTKPGFQDFLGLKENSITDKPSADPVPKTHLEQLGQVMSWLYGSRSDDKRPVIASQNPDLSRLSKVLEHPTARKVMLAKNDLAVAYDNVIPPIMQFETSLIAAKQYAEDAAGKVSAFDGEDKTLLEIADKLNKTTSTLYVTMQTMQTTKAPAGKKSRS